MLNAIASWLESPNNEALLLAEYHEDSLQVVAESCVLAAALLKNAADQVSEIEPPPESKITVQTVEEIAALASAFDASGDAALKRQASVLDELLLSIAAPPPSERKDLLASRTEELKKKYQDPSKELHEVNKLADSEKAIEKSEMTKNYRIMEAPLSTRYCPDHPGVQIARVGEHLWQCELDKKSYNFETGFELNNGAKVPGGDVGQQTQSVSIPYYAIFDTREGRLNAKTASADNNDVGGPGMLQFGPALSRRIVDLPRKIEEPVIMDKPDNNSEFIDDGRKIPEMLGEEDPDADTDQEWLLVKNLVSSKAWKEGNKATKLKLLTNLEETLNAAK